MNPKQTAKSENINIILSFICFLPTPVLSGSGLKGSSQAKPPLKTINNLHFFTNKTRDVMFF